MTIEQAFALALQHHQGGRLAEAEHLYRLILAAQPDHADAMHLLGVIADHAGQHAAGAELIAKAIALLPAVAAFHSNLGEAYRKLGRGDEAIAEYRRAIAIDPLLAEAHNNLGNVLKDQRRLDEAAAACRRALELRPDFPEALNNLGNVLKDQGAPDEAAAAYRHAIELRPGFTEVYSNLSTVLVDQGRLDEALAVCRRALHLDPNLPEAHNNLGNVLRKLGHLDDAVAGYRRAAQLKPDYAEAHSNLGNVLADLCRLDESVAAYRRALELHPGHAEAHSNLLLSLHYFPSLAATEIFTEHRRWEAVHARPLAKFITPHTNDHTHGRRLKVGYVSPDFREHSVAFFLEGLLAAHDRAQVEVFCYADVSTEDEFTARLPSSVTEGESEWPGCT